ncbi:hypothetical protein INT46_009573, partial [Mucor plumbeus]
EETQNIRNQETKINNAAPIKIDTEIKSMNTPVKNEQTEKTMQPEIEKEEKQQDRSPIIGAASRDTATASSVATTVVSGVAEFASAAAIAVSAAITSSGTAEMKNNDSSEGTKPEQKSITIDDTPVIHNITISEPKIEEPSTPTQEDNDRFDEHTTEITIVVPEIETIRDQGKSGSGSDLKIPCTIVSDKLSQDDIKLVDTNTDQGGNSSRTSTVNESNTANEEGQGVSKNNAKKVIRKSAVHPSNSRIRPPSINRGQRNTEKKNIPTDAVKKPAEGSDHKFRPQPRTTKASSSGGSESSGNAGATRIARLSMPIKKTIEPQQPQQSPVQQQQIKKIATKVSKRLPRVATLTKPPMPSSKVEQDLKDSVNTTEKPKKRLSSTKSFISRLTAPTVASANKKAAALGTTETERAPPTRRTSTLKKKQSLTRSNSISPQVINKDNSNNATSTTTPGHQQQPNNEMTSISTNGSFSRPTTPNKKEYNNDNPDDKNQVFIDTALETTI